jgi:hypothetical protein
MRPAVSVRATVGIALAFAGLFTLRTSVVSGAKAVAAATGVAAVDNDAAPPTQKIAVDLRGPLAVVTVTRILASERPRAGTEELLDLALPDRVALLSVELNDHGRWLPVPAAPAATARASYRETIRARGITTHGEPVDDDTTFRIHVARGAAGAGVIGDAPSSPITVRYRFSALVEDAHGRLRLRFPPSPESAPLPAQVSVVGSGLGDLEVAGVHVALATHGAGAGGSPSASAVHVSTRSGWEISYTFAPAALTTASGKEGPTLEGVAAIAATSARESTLAFSIHARPEGPPVAPENVLFVIDRSRSVGLPGLAAEHDVATRLLDLLPPTTRFDALFFDRAVNRLFPTLRPATREAIAALEPEMVPDRLVNGTDLAGALHAAGELLRRETSVFAPRALLVVISDGALSDVTTGVTLDAALGPIPGLQLGVALVVVRPADDDTIAPAARLALAAVAEARGGVERELRADEINESVAALVQILAAGGDVFSARVAFDSSAHSRTSAHLPDTVSPGSGVTGVVRLPGKLRGAAELVGVTRGHSLRAPLKLIPVDAAWLRPHAQDPPAYLESRVLSAPSLAAWVEPASHRMAPAATAETPLVRGTMDRDVIRNTLSLAFMPRARACYQTRSGATAAMRDLTGRVRMAIDLVRGEVMDARLESSTLAQPPIEACLRDSAFALEVPRAYRNDQPVTAIVNLVFRPRTPERKHSAEDSFPIGAEIDLVLEELKKAEAAEPAR